MKIFKKTLSTLLLAVSSFSLAPAHAGLDAQIDLSNPRIVPIYDSGNSGLGNNYTEAAFSGFLYSSRIVFSAAHSIYQFDQDGNRVYSAVKNRYVGMPNSRAGDLAGLVRVEKVYVASNYRSNNATLDDFAIFVLEKDLLAAAPVTLLTPEIEKYLYDNKVPIAMHGYGEFQDRCREGEPLPCSLKGNKSQYPRSLKTILRSLPEVEAVVGYQRSQLSNHLTMTNGKAGFGCSGDSGGSVTSTYMGSMVYLSTTPNGMNNYSCGASGDFDGKGGINYSSPVYKHLDILAEAEDFVAKMRASESTLKKTTITCIKGKTIKKVTATNPTCPKGYKKK